MLYFLIWRDVKIRYKQALIGAGWAIIQPLTTMLIFTVVFGYFAKIPSDGVPYPLFAYAGLLPWTYFAEATRRGATASSTDAESDSQGLLSPPDHPAGEVMAPLVDF